MKCRYYKVKYFKHKRYVIYAESGQLGEFNISTHGPLCRTFKRYLKKSKIWGQQQHLNALILLILLHKKQTLIKAQF